MTALQKGFHNYYVYNNQDVFVNKVDKVYFFYQQVVKDDSLMTKSVRCNAKGASKKNA